MNHLTDELLKIIADYKGKFNGAYSIRENGECVARQSSVNIDIVSKKDKPGLEVHVKPGTKDETVYIPACVTHGKVDDLVYNDFYIGEDSDVTIIAGCGVHSDDKDEARHNGIHRFFLGKGSRVLYKEKHVGTGKGEGMKRIDPVTDAVLEEDSTLEMDTIQIGGVDATTRTTKAVLKARAKLLVRERIMTEGVQTAKTDFIVDMEGEDSAADLVSRSVARGNSVQSFDSTIRGLTRCTGHSECDAILAENGRVLASPALEAAHIDAALIHEAAIGKIAGEQLLKLQSLGLTEQEAEEKIIAGFLK